ncbi:MAG: DUF4249 domain-containing protein [Culturomica sp.]|jgi:hypothetical protein|nr:DUF4249 domain-containing protein [Culturomica sp.]
MKTGICIFLGCAFCLQACTARIDISTADAPERLVIYGAITSDTMRHAVRITRSASFFATTPPEAISRAEVVITGGGEEFRLTENALEPGLYETDAGVFGTEGETYELYICLDFDGNGEPEEYEASSFLPPPPRMDSIGFRRSLINDHIEVLVWGGLPDNKENYLSLHLYRNGELMNDSLSRYMVMDDEFLDGKEVTAASCFFLDQKEDEETLVPGDRIVVRLDLITRDYAEFIWNAQSEIQGSNPIFGGPPANVPTNIRARNGAATPISGFFTAYSGRSAGRVYDGVE